MAKEIDYEALAKKFGAIDQPQTSDSAAVDYDALAAQYGAAESPQTREEPSITDQLKRQAGLTARYGIEGIGDVVGIVQNPLSALTGGAIPRASEVYPQLATNLGLPQPDTPTQRIIGAASRGIVGAGSMAGPAGQLARIPGAIGQFGNIMATAPVSQIASGGLGGGSTQTAKEMGASPETQAVSGLVGAISPTLAAQTLPKIGGKIADVVGGIGTHTGGESLRQAAKAGLKGGESQRALIENMRGKVPIVDVLDDARANLQDMAKQRAALYRAGMADISNDNTVLSFNGIDNSIQSAAGKVHFGTKIKNAAGAKVLDDITEAVNEWRSSDPVKYHTPEGMDALKQRIGGIVEAIPINEKTALNVGRDVYNSIKNEITKQAPTYSKVMKGYQTASEQITEIEKSLIGTAKTNPDTALRKLQSIMRNNVNTNYGRRAELATQLEQQGGREIMPALAGQALSSKTPRGLGSAAASVIGAGGLYTMNPLAIPLMATQSPRLMGEGALKIGQLSRLASPLATTPESAALNALIYGGLGANQ